MKGLFLAKVSSKKYSGERLLSMTFLLSMRLTRIGYRKSYCASLTWLRSFLCWVDVTCVDGDSGGMKGSFSRSVDR